MHVRASHPYQSATLLRSILSPTPYPIFTELGAVLKKLGVDKRDEDMAQSMPWTAVYVNSTFPTYMTPQHMSALLTASIEYSYGQNRANDECLRAEKLPDRQGSAGDLSLAHGDLVQAYAAGQEESEELRAASVRFLMREVNQL